MKIDNYHERSQKFIKSSHAMGYHVTAEDGELIAHPPGSPGYKKVPQSVIKKAREYMNPKSTWKPPSYKGYKWGQGTGG